MRHRKYKTRPANELAPIILERVIRFTTKEGDVVCDPFVGGGVTAYVAERLKLRWIAGDLNDCSAARQRLMELKNGTHPEWNSTRKRMTASGGAAESPTLSLF